MGKAEKGSIKYLANKMKAKGLQKLRWYCQMCQKQCRDENGFKCHTMSESHQRQLLLFADNSGQYIDQFSKEFSDGFCELLRRQFGTKRVSANKVYQDYIADREHLHMNATQWETLTEFVKWLGREGRCTVDETEKGWFVTHIDRDPAAIASAEAAAKKDKMDKDDQERMMEFIEKQVKRGKDQGASGTETSYTELQRTDPEHKVTVSLKTKSTGQQNALVPSSSLKVLDKRKAEEGSIAGSTSSKRHKDGNTKKMSALDEIKLEEEKRKQRFAQKQAELTSKAPKKLEDNWLFEDIVVKVITKSLGDKYYKKKGVVKRILETYVGEVHMIDSGDKLKLDQDHLETVIPGEDRDVLIVLGKYRGLKGKMMGLTDDSNACKVMISYKISTLQFNQVSKLQR